ncbi:hypothetical protein [Streptomyces griseoluteus]
METVYQASVDEDGNRISEWSTRRAHPAQRLCDTEHEAAAEHDLYSRDLKENR